MPRGTPLAVDIHYSGTIDDRLQSNTPEWSVVDYSRRNKSPRAPVIIKKKDTIPCNSSLDTHTFQDSDFPLLPKAEPKSTSSAPESKEPTLQDIVDEYNFLLSVDESHFEKSCCEPSEIDFEMDLAFENDAGWYVNCEVCDKNRHTHTTDEQCRCTIVKTYVIQTV